MGFAVASPGVGDSVAEEIVGAKLGEALGVAVVVAPVGADVGTNDVGRSVVSPAVGVCVDAVGAMVTEAFELDVVGAVVGRVGEAVMDGGVEGAEVRSVPLFNAPLPLWPFRELVMASIPPKPQR